ncbi:MAG: PspC domain-containing protein [Phycisphaerae bacterium]|nr:PspC domain-containing protein [Phycisphaerae bacterium]
MTRIYRSRTDKVFGGVCGGLGHLLDVDPTILRLGLVFLTILTGIVPLVVTYIIAWAIIPEEPTRTQTPMEQGPAQESHPQGDYQRRE